MQMASATGTLKELRELQRFLTPQERVEMDRLLKASTPVWVPLPGPQTDALNSDADILFYGGAAGGGKTDLAIGLALTRHVRSIIFRRQFPQLQGIYDRMAEILGGRNGFNSQDKIWVLPGRKVEFGSCPNVGDEAKYQGRPHDLKVFDEITHFSESQFRFLNGWLRSVRAGQRKRVLCTGNPPTDSDGDWVISYWGPWLNPDHPNPAKPGELRWFATINGKDFEVPDNRPFVLRGEERVYDIPPNMPEEEIIRPMSRTFIPSKVQDNPFLMETGYMRTLQNLPEPLRSQMLKGDFGAGRSDDPWQVLPTAWVKAAQDRWKPQQTMPRMTAMGVDVARGGKDRTVIARRHGLWWDELLTYPGTETPNGPVVAGLCISARRDAAPIYLDIIGPGASVFDFLAENRIPALGINGAEKSGATDKSGQLRFRNKRAELYWKLREMLDPKNGTGIALPPGQALRSDLCAPRWSFTQAGILVESKDDIKKRLGRSPDEADAIMYSCEEATPVFRDAKPIARTVTRKNYAW